MINLPERRDRRRRIASELHALGCFHWELFEAVRRSNAGPFKRVGSHGAYLSHLELLESAAEQGSSILILQDDCTFLPNVNWVAPQPGTDIFYGGYLAYTAPNSPETSDIIGAHCMGFSARAAASAAAYLRRRLECETELPPIDGTLVQFRREMGDRIKSEFQLVALQWMSPSNISPNKLDKVPYVSEVLRPLRWLKTVNRKRALA